MPTSKSINIAVAEQVEKLGSGKVVDTVVQKLVETEITKRADALASAIKLAEDVSRELKKASRPDQVSIAVEGGAKTETFSAKAFEAKKKLEERAAKIEKVVESATEKGNWGDLYNLVKGGGSVEAKPDEPAANT